MLVKFGAIITDGVNSIGGHTISSNHYGRYQKNKPIPTLVQNDWTTRTRGNLGTLSQAWRNLTPSERLEWIEAAPSYPRTNSLGEIYYPTGFNLFIWLNQNLTLVGSAMATSVPSRTFPAMLPSFSIVSWTPEDPKLNITFDSIPDDGDCKLVFFASRGLSPGINFVSDALRFFTYGEIGMLDLDLSTPYNAKFGFQPSSTKVFVKCFYVHQTSGLQSIPMFANSLPV